MKKILLSLLFFILFFGNIIFAEETEITIYSSDIWLSNELTFADEKVRIYSKFENENDFDVKQIAEFYDNDEKIGEKNIEIASNSFVIIWIDANLKYGEHRIISKIKESSEDNLKEGEKTVNINTSTNLKIINVDLDTDSDGVGDEKDADDDNDGVSDVVEIEKGSDPKSKISTPKIEETKEVIKTTSETTKNVILDLVNVLTEKRESLEKQIQKNIEEKEISQEEAEVKKEIDIKSHEISEEKEVILEQSKNENFEKISQEKKKVFLESKNISDVIKIAKIETKKIDNLKLTNEEREFAKACLFQAKYEKIEELAEEEKSGFWSSLWYWILLFLSIVFKNNFLTLIFMILIFWLIWKIIKRF